MKLSNSKVYSFCKHNFNETGLNHLLKKISPNKINFNKNNVISKLTF